MNASNAALALADLILSKSSNVSQIVRMFDLPGARFSKGELVAVAASRGLDVSGNRSALCYRIARAAVA